MEHSDLLAELQELGLGRHLVATVDDGPPYNNRRLTVFAMHGAFSRSARFQGIAALKERFGFDSVSIETVTPRQLLSKQSVESFVRSFRGHRIVSDPTGAVERAKSLLQLGERLRREGLTDRLMFHPLTGRVVVLSKNAGLSTVDHLPANRFTFHGGLPAGISEIVTLNELPPGEFTPIDDRSVHRTFSGPQRWSLRLALRGLIMAIGIGGAATASASVLETDPRNETVIRPGVSAMVGLTTLAENPFGDKNIFRGTVGMKLYMGDASPVELALCGLIPGLRDDCKPNSRLRTSLSDERSNDERVKPIPYGN